MKKRLSVLLAVAVSVLVTVGGIAARSPSTPEVITTPPMAATTVSVPTPPERGSTMKTKEEIQAMLDRFDGLQHEDIEGRQAEGIYETLLWLQGDRSDGDLAAFIPD